VTFLTDFADQAVILPVVAAIAIALLVQGNRRGALLWLGTIAVVFGLILALKLAFLACGPGFGPSSNAWAMRSPSGHTAAAAAFAGGLTALLTRRTLAPPLIALVSAAIIGFTRVALREHTIPEVVLAGFLGIAGVIAMTRLARSLPVARPLPLLLATVTVAVPLHGLHLPAETVIQNTAAGAARVFAVCARAGQAADQPGPGQPGTPFYQVRPNVSAMRTMSSSPR